MDLADQCDVQNEVAQQFDILNSRKPEGPKPIGKCRFCGEKVGPEARFCDAECATDYARFHK